MISTGVPRGHPSFLLFVFSVEEKIILLAFTDWCHVWKHISFSDCGCILPSRVVISQWSGHLMCSWWLPLSCLLITLTHSPVCSDWGRPGQLLPCKQSEPEATDMGAEPDCLCNWIILLRFLASNGNINVFFFFPSCLKWKLKNSC